jgi:hypothetical protein
LAVELDGLRGAFGERRAQSLFKFSVAFAADFNVIAVRQPDDVSRIESSRLRPFDRQLREDSLVQIILSPRSVEAGGRLEVVAELLEIGDAAPAARGALEEADRDAARGQKCRGRQPADPAADDHDLVSHRRLEETGE